MPKKVARKTTAAKTSPTKKAPRKKTSPKKSEPVSDALYPVVSAKLCAGDDAMTVKLAKELLGWTEEPDGQTFGTDYILKLPSGKKVRCLNNTTNRPFSLANAQKLKQDILKGNWEFNGETVIIGRNGQVLNGQHSMVALVLAGLEWRQNDLRDKLPHWRTEPVIDKLVAFGVSEEDRVVNTIDTGSPRTLTDVLYRSEYFASLKPGDRKTASRMADYAVRLLWQRTKAKDEPFCAYRTHKESIAFIEHHPTLLKCVRHILDENEEGKLGAFISPGYAAGLMYLMAASETDPREYVSHRSETNVDLSKLDAAEDFFVLLASGDKKLAAVRKALGEILSDEEGTVSMAEKLAVLVKAWNLFTEGSSLTPLSVSPEYHIDEEGIKSLAEYPTVGGIDIDDLTNTLAADVTPDEAEQRAAAIRAAKDKKSAGYKPPKNSIKELDVNDRFWVGDDPEEAYQAKIVGIARIAGERTFEAQICVGFPGAGNVEAIREDDPRINLTQPIPGDVE